MTRDPMMIAWAAGLFEGKGSFCVYNVNGGIYLRVSMQTTTDLDVLERFRDVVGCGNIRSVRKDPRNPNGKPVFQWQAYGEEKFRAIFEEFRPFLGARRVARAMELLEMPKPPKRKYRRRALSVS